MKPGRRLLVLLVATTAVSGTCAGLGIWQLQRLSSRRSFNARLLQRGAAPALEGLPNARGGPQDPFAYRRIRVDGAYDPAHEVLLRARALDGAGGNHVLTPLRVTGGRAVIVDRGWVPLEYDRPPVSAAAPPSGRVAVEGILVPQEPPPRLFGPRDPPRGRLATIGRLDIARLDRQIPYAVEPLALVLERQSPAGGALPRIAAVRPPGEGPHLSYAVQWFIFATCALATGSLLAVRENRYRRIEEAARA